MTQMRQTEEAVVPTVSECSRSGTLNLDEQNPWPGPAAYDEASSDFFYGRTQEASELLGLIKLAALTVVYGKSGLGKTSLLQAGLYPLLRAEHYLPVHLRIDFSSEFHIPPLMQVMLCLTAALDNMKAEYPTPNSGESLWGYLHRNDLEIWSEDNFPVIPVLIFDQFEEVFSRSGGNSELIQQVFYGLADLVENRIPADIASEAGECLQSDLDLRSQRYRIVLSFREDFLPEVRAWEQNMPSLLSNCLRLEPMSRARAIEAVEQAGKAVLDEGVAPCIVDFVGRLDRTIDSASASDITIEPVLLSLCCSQLNRRRPPGARIDKVLVEEAGQDILDNFYRETLDDPEVKGSPDVALFIEDYLIQGDHFRGDYPEGEALAKNLITNTQLIALTDRHHLLRLAHHPDTTRVELIHDRLVPVVRKARDERRIKQHREEQELLAKKALHQAEIERGRAKVARRNERKMKAISVGVIFLFFIGLITGGLAYKKQQEANKMRYLADKAELTSQVALATSRLAEGRLALTNGSEPLEQIMYRGLAAYRLANRDVSQPRAESLIALHSAMGLSGHLRKILKLEGFMPTAALAYSPNGQTLAIGGEDGVIRLLDAVTFKHIASLDCHQTSAGSVWSLAYNSDGKRLAAGYSREDNAVPSGLVCVFDITKRSILRSWSAKELWGKASNIYSVAYGGKPGAEFVISGGSDKMMRKLDIYSGSMSEVPHPQEVISVAISPDGNKLASGSGDAIIRVWDLADFSNPKARSVELKGHEDIIQQIMFSPADPSVLVSAGDDGRVMIWSVGGSNNRNSCLMQQSKQQFARIYNVAVSKNGHVAAASADGNVRLFQPLDIGTTCSKRTGKRISSAVAIPEFDVIRDGVLSGHGGVVLGIAFHPEGERLASAGQNGSIRIWGPKTEGFSLAQLEQGSPHGSVTTLAISPDGKSIAAGDSQGNIHLWAPPDIQEPVMQPTAASWKAHEKSVRSLAYIRMANRLVLVSGGDDGVIKRWDAGTRQVSGVEMMDDAEAVQSIAVSPDGKLLAVGGMGGTVRLWDAMTGKRLPTKFKKPDEASQGYELYAVGFSADGKYLVVGDVFSELRVLDLKAPSTDRRLQGHVSAIKSLTRGGARWVLSAGLDGSLMEWEQSALSKPQAEGLQKHDEFKFRMGFGDRKKLTSMDTSSDGRLIVTGGEMKGQISNTKWGLVQLWDGGERVLIGERFQGHGRDREVRAVAMAPDASFFVTADDDSKILVWPGPDRWADIICSKLTSNMSHSEWRKWVSPKIDYVLQCPGLAVPKDLTPIVAVKKSSG